MKNGSESEERVRGKLRIALGAFAVLVLLFVVPPLINVNHYKNQITGLLSRSLGRPVRLASVQAHVLPWPGFEITDLSVAEDPAFGAEPVLHANTVTASIRLLALLRGRVEIGKISVDEASLNLVRAGPGRWNLDPIFRTAAAETQSVTSQRGAPPLPYLEATDSRINFKNGAEKLPFSLVNADLSFWQENPGEWRIRLRGQPARTDVSLYLEETGEVRMEASIRQAPTLGQMPLHLDLEWREAQWGQLARLITGSDPGWRGDLTGELHLDGNADAARISMRLRATGVHRAEFTPASPLDFDANCGLLYHYAQRSFENLACDSPLGDGHIHVTGEQPGATAPPRFSIELTRVPVAAGLDALRTIRSGVAPDLEVKGTVSGRIVYDVHPGEGAETNNPKLTAMRGQNRPAKVGTEEQEPLGGSLIVENFEVSGGGLNRPIQAPKFALEPVLIPPACAQPCAATEGSGSDGATDALTGAVAIPAGGTAPLDLSLRLSLSGYQVGARGQASFARARELARAAGIPETTALASLAGEPITVDLTADGPWMPPEEIPVENAAVAAAAPANSVGTPAAQANAGSLASPVGDRLTGTVTLHNANWKADFLAGHLGIGDATLHIEDSDLRWDPVEFTYGPLKGSAMLTVPLGCAASPSAPENCQTQFEMQFSELDVGALESALLGAREKGTLLSTLIDRLHPSTAPPWPQVEGKVNADTVVVGPVKVSGVTASLRITPAGAEITSFDGGLFGGTVHLGGTLTKPATDRDKPAYSLHADFEKLDATDVGKLLGLRWTGSPLSGTAKVDLIGYTDEDLSASAKGSLHFEARQGSIAAIGHEPKSAPAEPTEVPNALAHFAGWTGDASIANGAIELGENAFIAGGRERSVAGTITFGAQPEVIFKPTKEMRSKKPIAINQPK